jgi:hypothetical protein
LCRKSSSRSLVFKTCCLSARNFLKSETFPSMSFLGGPLGNGDEAGASAQTDDRTSLGLSNCDKIVESLFSVKRGRWLTTIPMYSKRDSFHEWWLKLKQKMAWAKLSSTWICKDHFHRFAGNAEIQVRYCVSTTMLSIAVNDNTRNKWLNWAFKGGECTVWCNSSH